MARKKVLIVSDSFGTPIHARGIFNFTYGVVEILRRLGHEVYLLVQSPSCGSFSTTKQSDLDLPENAGLNRSLFSDLIRHFEGDRFSFEWNYPDSSEERLAREHPHVMNFRLAMNEVHDQRHQLQFKIERSELHEHAFTVQTAHLKLFDGFVARPEVYAESFRRGGKRLRPIFFNAEKFDHVIIDTPHYINIVGMDRTKIHYVIHDFIPFYDGHMGYDWRQLFASKIECTVKTGRSAIFNSETTKRYFQKIFPTHIIDKHITIYPPIREEVRIAAAGADRTVRSKYPKAIRSNKKVERRQWAKNIAKARGLRKLGWLGAVGAKVPKWQADLPFFCTVLSDEPRKNVAAFVEASRAFVGEANFIAIGQIDGDRYMNRRADKYPNLHFTGYLSDERKLDLIRGCEAFIFPSLSEGFGIPIVEAATMRAPVICTDIEVFREVTYGFAYYFDPSKSGDLIRAIREMRADPARDARAAELKKMVDAAFMQDEMAKRMEYLFEEVEQ